MLLAATPAQTCAVVVGIERYNVGDRWNLDGPASDAVRFVEWLYDRGVPSGNILVLLAPLEENRQPLSDRLTQRGVQTWPANHDPLMDALTNCLPGLKGELLFLFWGGHGTITVDQERWLFCANATAANYQVIGLDYLLARLRSRTYSRFRLQIGIIDACANYFEEMRSKVSLAKSGPSQGEPDRDIKQFVLYGAATGEVAANDKVCKTGAFSELVLETLRQDSRWPPDMSALASKARAYFEQRRGEGQARQTPVYYRYQSGVEGVEKDILDLTGKPYVIDDLSRLPEQPLGVKFVGREERLDDLRKAYKDPNIAVVAVIGSGGIGKSFLIRTFLKECEQQKYYGAQWVYAWSFHDDQKETYSTSSTEFFGKALSLLGYQGELPKSATVRVKSATVRAELLSERLRACKSLLVLDGVEALQFPPREFEQGKKNAFSDQDMSDLLKDLCQNGLFNGGRVFVTSRQPLVELDGFKGKTYCEIELKPFEDDEGAKLLDALEVKGTVEELSKASRDMGGHPLALVLLGKMLTEYEQFKGHVRNCPRLPPLQSQTDHGSYAKRIMEWYDKKWWPENAPERIFLRLLGLFDRPMEGGELKKALLVKSDIAKPLTLSNLSARKWSDMIQNLCRAGLLAGNDKAVPNRGYYLAKWDTHPLVREYFGEQLREFNRDGWRQAHEVLFKYFQGEQEVYQPNDAVGLKPLYSAVRHGCMAEKYEKAYELYRFRIARDNDGFDTEKLHLTMPALVAVSCFFQGSDLDGDPHLDGEARAWLLARGSYCLESVGRLEKAEDLRERSNKEYKELKMWLETATGAGELAMLQIYLGKLKEAYETAIDAVGWANKAVAHEESHRRVNATKRNERLEQAMIRQFATQSTLATILHRQGELWEALRLFKEAEKIHKKVEGIRKRVERKLPLLPLHSVPGVRYCALLLDMAKYEEALERAEKMLKGYKDLQRYDEHHSEERRQLYYPLMDALHHLNKGRILTELGRGRWDEAKQELDLAQNEIHQHDKIQFECQPFLARAVFWHLTNELGKAHADLTEVLRISQDCQMPLYQADAQLLLGHVELDHKHKITARKAFKEAGTLIERHEYKLRLAELDLLEARLCHFEGDTNKARKKFEDAREYFEKIGYERLHRQWEHIKNELGIPDSLNQGG